MRCLFRSTLFAICACLTATLGAVGPHERLAEMGLSLPPTSPSIANYVNAVRAGDLLYLSGHLPRDPDGQIITGKLGADASVEDGQAAAARTALALLATINAELGSLDHVARIVRLTGMVNATNDFTDHSLVINGASDLLGEVLGERGRHTRSAAGFSSLPRGALVEISMIVQVKAPAE